MYDIYEKANPLIYFVRVKTITRKGLRSRIGGPGGI